MATHSSILARITRTKATAHEVARVGHDLVTKLPPYIRMVSELQKYQGKIQNSLFYILMSKA